MGLGSKILHKENLYKDKLICVADNQRHERLTAISPVKHIKKWILLLYISINNNISGKFLQGTWEGTGKKESLQRYMWLIAEITCQ